jgi:hypothetical protein
MCFSMDQELQAQSTPSLRLAMLAFGGVETY